MIGAGCSVEPPTSLRSAADCAEHAHNQLVQEGLLQNGDCEDPSNLETLADVVVEKYGCKQELVLRLPKQAFRHATPNHGHRVVAALMAEGIVNNVITVNFDLALTTAVAQAGIGAEVSTLSGPEDHANLGLKSLIYLHRNAYAKHEDWVLTTAEVEQSWTDGWESIMASAVLTAPSIVFAGVGTLIGALLHGLKRVKEAIPDGVDVYQVDPAPPGGSKVRAALGIEDNNYMQSGWVAFASEIGDHVNESHVAALVDECREVAARNEWPEQDIAKITQALDDAGLLGFGRARASWFRHEGEYRAIGTLRISWLAELILGLALIRSSLGGSLSLSSDGEWHFSDDGRPVLVIGCLHGQGDLRWAQLSAEVNYRRGVRWLGQSGARVFLVAGLQGSQPAEFSTPEDIGGSRGKDNLFTGPDTVDYITVDMVRADPDGVRERLVS